MKTMKLKNTINKGLSLSYFYFVLNTVLSIFISSFIIRTVGKTDYGVYQSMSAFVSYLLLLEFGTGTIMSRNISLCKKDGTDSLEIQKNVSTIWTLTAVLSIAIILVSFVFWLSIDKIYAVSMTASQILLGKKVFFFTVITLLSSFLTQMLNGLILGFEHYTFEKTVSIAKLILRALLLVVFLSVNSSVIVIAVIDSLLGISLFLCSLIFCITKIKVKFVFKYFDINIFKYITPLAFAMLLQTVVNTANGSVDKFLISIMMTPEDVSVYSIAMSLFTMFSSIATLPVSMFMPQIAGNMRKGLRGRELTESLVQPCRLNIIISGIVAFGFFSVGKFFIGIVYGKEFMISWVYAIVVIFPMFINMSNAVIINVIDVLRKRHIRSLILMITTGLNIILTVILIKVCGMFGAAFATGVSLLIQTVLLNIYYQKKIGLSVIWLFGKGFKGLLPCFAVAVAFSVLVQQTVNNIYLKFFIGGFGFVALFAAMFYFFGANDYEKNKICVVLKKYLNK